MRLQKEMPDKIRINGTMENRLPGNANVSFEGSNASELIFKLDEKGIVFLVVLRVLLVILNHHMF